MAWTLLSAVVLAGAEDPRLAKLRAVLEPMRRAQDSQAPRGATPAHTTVKGLLRDWAESRLAVFRPGLDPAAVARAWNQELERAKLLCPSGAAVAFCFETPVGVLGEYSLQLQQGVFLAVTTRVGIVCGFDESLYVYRWSNPGWRLVLTAETNDYAPGKYRPQRIEFVMVSDLGSASRDRLALVLGSNPACASGWQSVYHRVWRLPQDGPATLLLAGDQVANIGFGIRGSTSPGEVMFEVIGSGMSAGNFRHEIRRYVLEDGRLVRRPPVAATPVDFIDTWYETPWLEASGWTEASARQKLAAVHREAKPEHFVWSYDLPSRWCPAEPDLWQVGATLTPTVDAPAGLRPRSLFFTVRWRPPYRFTLADVAGQPRAGCTQEDPAADAGRSLFPARPD